MTDRKNSQIDVMASMCEPYCLKNIHLREVSTDGFKGYGEKRLYIKLQGVNEKSGVTEQLHIYLNQLDCEHLAQSFQDQITNGLFKKNE